MKNFFYIIFGAVIFSFLSINGQTVEEISKERYDFLFDSLMTVKADLLSEKEDLLSSIDSLKVRLDELALKSESSRTDQLKRKYGSDIGRRISLGQVWKGMTEKMLEESWGKPDKITKNKEKWGTFTQWYYGSITYFFKDGIMTDWEEK